MSNPLLFGSLLAFLSRQRDEHQSLHPQSAHAYNNSALWLQHALSQLNIHSIDPSSAPPLEDLVSLGYKEFEYSRYRSELLRSGFFDTSEDPVLLEGRARTRFEDFFKSRRPDLSTASHSSSSTSQAVARKQEGNELFQQKDFESALTCYLEAATLDPTNPIYPTNASACFYNLGKFEEALSEANKAISIDNTYFKGYYRKGSALVKLERPAEAREALNKALELSPDYEPASSLLNSLPLSTEESSQPPSQVSAQFEMPGDIGQMMGQVMGDPQFMQMAGQMASSLFGGRTSSSQGGEEEGGEGNPQPQCPQQ
ncbi:hypothetical protein P9112_012117 [Eukaryota sp. TZLM1-RC]